MSLAFATAAVPRSAATASSGAVFSFSSKRLSTWVSMRSRIDTLVDKRLEEKLKTAPDEAVAALRGTAAVANAKLIYQRFKQIFGSDGFLQLQEKGGKFE